jgi:hypothetical protein
LDRPLRTPITELRAVSRLWIAVLASALILASVAAWLVADGAWGLGFWVVAVVVANAGVAARPMQPAIAPPATMRMSDCRVM